MVWNRGECRSSYNNPEDTIELVLGDKNDNMELLNNEEYSQKDWRYVGSFTNEIMNLTRWLSEKSYNEFSANILNFKLHVERSPITN